VSLLDHDGFDGYATADIPARWLNSSGTTITTAAKRNGVNGLRHPSVNMGRWVPASGNIFIAGFAIRWDALAANMTVIAVADTSFSTSRVHIVGNLAGTISARIGGIGGTLLGTTTWVAVVDTWYYLEVKIIFDTTNGSVEIRVTDAPGLAYDVILNISGIDTTNGGGTTWHTYFFNHTAADYDDLYICDGEGDYNNDFLGDCISEWLVAQSDAGAEGAGFNAGLTPSTGTNHGALVDDATPNGDTDYNAGTTAGVKDTYHVPSITSVGAIRGAQVRSYAKKMEHVTKTVCAVVRTGGADYDGESVHPTTAYEYLSDIFETNPNTGLPWTGLQIEALQAGLKVVV